MKRLMAFMGVLALVAPAAMASLYAEDFNADHTANWMVNDPGLSDIGVDFFYDYSAIGVPAAPNGSGTRGLKMTCNNSGGVFSGFSVSPLGQSFSGNYKLSFDMWLNYVGPLGAGGSGTTQLGQVGIGTAGNVPMWPGAGTKESVTFAATLDGGSSVDYRVYSSAQPTGYPDADPVFAAGAHAGNRNESDPYYTAAFPGTTAPAAQTLLFPGQTGT
ncbi:MAG TPA: hypothetical protein P5572_09630, partial [Phycisphaerae bacterium]|nr:hypothetical protein [Phycisphaerae bacterium]